MISYGHPGMGSVYRTTLDDYRRSKRIIQQMYLPMVKIHSWEYRTILHISCENLTHTPLHKSAHALVITGIVH